MTGPTTPVGEQVGEQVIAIRAWLVVDLLRLLDYLRTAQPSWVDAAVRDDIRDDLDYHAGLLRHRLHRNTRQAAHQHHKDHS
jgi:hypothetical protein